MQKWVVICLALLVLVTADECPDGGTCKEGQTCCNSPANGYECCPFEQAECCEDHVHCCPAGTICDESKSSCVNSTVSTPWAQRTATHQPRLSKSFRMIKTYMGEDDDNVCPDQSRCPPEFSCLRALTKFGCCPLAQGIPCSDGKHCCPEGHMCSSDSRSCIKKELVTTVLCSDGVSECPDETTCCETPEGKWGCCPMPKAVCCQDKTHCCPEGSTCDVKQSKCISLSTKKEMPMWAKFPARTRAEWENQKGQIRDKSETNDKRVHFFFFFFPPDVPCDDTISCPDNTTCCKTKKGGWACCPYPEAVCCQDMLHCCPKGKTCNLAAMTCDDDSCSVPWAEKIPTIPRKDAQARNVTCDSTASCPDGSTCCKTTEGTWACCPLPEAVCCEDHEHCCPKDTTCDLANNTCDSASGPTPMKQKMPAFVTTAPTAVAVTTAGLETTAEPRREDRMEATEREEQDEKDRIHCDHRTSCPPSSTCCFMSASHQWGCCPLPHAVCCSDGSHCCPPSYKCNEDRTSCIKADVEIPWYTKLPATTGSDEAEPSATQCDGNTRCPEHTTCCRLPTGKWGCCPLKNAVCCPDQEHCCPQGYSCHMASQSCQKLVMLQLETVPLTKVDLPEPQPEPQPEPHCPDGETCCRTSATTWGCCPSPNAVCCSDMKHCCPTGFTCTPEGQCTQRAGLQWHDWHMFFGNKKKGPVV
uniref:Granulin a n=1 Tax=Sphaeramia orbicularis TaxID=375764 RepID=A0A672YVM1_9TELE